MSPHALRWLALLLALPLAGCILTPLERRDRMVIQTAHYDIWSSLDEDESAQLAVELERFRAAAEFVWRAQLRAEPVRTREAPARPWLQVDPRHRRRARRLEERARSRAGPLSRGVAIDGDHQV